MSKPKLRNKDLDNGEKIAKRVLAQVRILDSCEHLRGIQSQTRRDAQVLSKLQKLPVIPDIALRELLTKLKKRDLRLAGQIAAIRKNLDVACELLKPPGCL